jgi:hypothetical protein
VVFRERPAYHAITSFVKAALGSPSCTAENSPDNLASLGEPIMRLTRIAWERIRLPAA